MSKSTNSASTTSPQVKKRVLKKYIRDRTLKRGVMVDGFKEKYLRRLFVAYRMGEMPSFADGLTSDEFKEDFREIARNVQIGFLLDSKSLVGLVNVGYSVHVIHPVFHYFSWATPRNKLETALKFFLEVKQHARALMTVPKGGTEARMLSHLGKYGVIRGIGDYKGFYDDGDARFFQTIGK